MHLVHRDQNYIYNFWPREGESIALAWGRLKSMLYSCPNHELSRETVIQNFYARLSRDDQSMLDTSCTGSFMKKAIEFRWDLLERIKRNSKDWELEEGKESGIKLESDCVKSFMDTDAFHKFSTKYGLDSEIVASFVNHLLLMLISLRRSGLNIIPLLKKRLRNPLVLKKKQLFTMLIQLCLLLILRNHLFLLGLRNMLKFQLWLTKVILEHLNPLNKLKLNLILLWLRISWLIILMGMLFTSAMKQLELLNLILKIKTDPLWACLLSQLK